MTLDHIQFLPDFVRWYHPVVDMAGFDALRWEVFIVIVKVFDFRVVVSISGS